jgi:hypothetical protein
VGYIVSSARNPRFVVFLPPETPDLWCFFRQKRLFLISIPSGAIKSEPMGNFYPSVLQTHCKCNAMAIQWQCNGLHCYKSLKQKFIDISDMVKKNVTSVNIQQMPENLSANAEQVESICPAIKKRLKT